MAIPTSPTRCGLAGWHYPHWNGVVYPAAKAPDFHPLEFLASRVDALEIDHSVYEDLKPEISRLWVHQVSHNPRFQFVAKLHQRFTHLRDLDKPQIEAFHSGLRPIVNAGRLGCVLM